MHTAGIGDIKHYLKALNFKFLTTTTMHLKQNTESLYLKSNRFMTILRSNLQVKNKNFLRIIKRMVLP